jgi:hypothetical protein
MVPEAVSYGIEFSAWKDKFNVKIRRAKHNVRVWVRCLRLLFERRLRLPKKIAVPEIFLYLFSPVILMMLLAMTGVLVFYYPLPMSAVLLGMLSILVLKRPRLLVTEIVQSNCFLFLAIISLISRRESVRWKTLQDPRTLIGEDVLKSKNLI